MQRRGLAGAASAGLWLGVIFAAAPLPGIGVTFRVLRLTGGRRR